jgi:outer membrane protein TolC
VLAAFQQVEDNLALLRELETTAQAQGDAVASAQLEVQLALNRYQEGVVDYLEVITAQTRSLQTQRDALDLDTQRLNASVNLIRALGGGWSTEQLGDSRETPSPSRTNAG